MRLFNRCRKCDVRIPWRKRAYFGNAYTPVICEACSTSASVQLYGSVEAYRAAMDRALFEELRR